MAILTDTDLERIINTPDNLQISPYNESCLTPLGYDLRIGNNYSTSNNTVEHCIKHNETFIIKSGETVFIKILERITMPKDKSITGLIVSKVSITAKGLVHDTTTIDPDWSGDLLLVMHNLSKADIILKGHESICTVIFLSNNSSSSRDSNKPTGRNEILVASWSSETKRINAKKSKLNFLKRIAPVFIIGVSYIAGFLLWGNASGLIASVAVGVALSQCLFTK